MQLNLTKQQLKKLIELVYLGNWMANAIHTGTKEDPKNKAYEKLEQLIFSKAYEEGFKKEIEYNEKYKDFFPTRDFEEGTLEKYINDYDEENFWEELYYRLARRDFAKKYGEEAISKMSVEERIEKEQPFTEKYEDELYRHGIDRLLIEERNIPEKISRNEPCPCGTGKKYKKCCGQ